MDGRATDPTKYWAVMNDRGRIVVVSSPGRNHAALWLTREEAEAHAERMRKIHPGHYGKDGEWVEPDPYVVREVEVSWPIL